jgi:hypothetical protein
MTILQWEKDQAEIISRLQNPAKLKICCKTRSEPEFIQDWIAHHRPIVGSQNLIIADNGSSDTVTLDVYSRVNSDVTIFAFGGSHNDIHWHPRFRSLFDCVKQTAEFFSFIDVDERLTWIDQERWFADERILDCLTDKNTVYPTTWLINAIESLDRFTLLDTERRRKINNNLRWGKPIIPSDLIAIHTGIHNIQFSGSPFSENNANNLFLLHLTQFPDQRIAANVRKLVSRNLLDPLVNPRTIAGMNFSNHPDPTVLRFQKEIAEMIAYLEGDKSISDSEAEFLTLRPEGNVEFSSLEARNSFFRFIADRSAITMEMFK